MRYQAFEIVANVSVATPRTKIALMKHAYTRPTVLGYCPLPDKAKIATLMKNDMAKGRFEEVLNYFHHTLGKAYEALSNFDKVKFLGNVDVSMVEVLYTTVSKKPNNLAIELISALGLAAGKMRERLFAMLDGNGDGKDYVLRSKCPVEIPSAPAVAEEKKGDGRDNGKKEESELPEVAPKVLQFDGDGNPVSEQDSIVDTKVSHDERYNWMAWVKTDVFKNHYEFLCAKWTCITAIMKLHLRTVDPELKVEIKKEKGKVKCVALTDFEVGAIRLPLAIWRPETLADKSEHPHALVVDYEETRAGNATEGGTKDFKIRRVFKASPDLSLPKLAPSVEGRPSDHEWKPSNSANLFWAIKRYHEESEWNCDTCEVRVNEVVAVAFNACATVKDKDPISMAAQVTLPLITNARKIKQGDELVLKCPPPPEKEKKDPKRKTWITEAKAIEKKSMDGGSSNNAMPSKKVRR